MMLVPLAAVALQGACASGLAVAAWRGPGRARGRGRVPGGARGRSSRGTADEPPARPDWYADLDALPAGTAVLNDWGEGGYLMWRFPDLDFVMNGYGDIYTDAELARNFRMDGTDPGWVADVKGTGARVRAAQAGVQARLRARDPARAGRRCSAATRSCCSKPPTTGRRPTSETGADMAEPRRSGVRRRGPQA